MSRSAHSEILHEGRRGTALLLLRVSDGGGSGGAVGVAQVSDATVVSAGETVDRRDWKTAATPRMPTAIAVAAA